MQRLLDPLSTTDASAQRGVPRVDTTASRLSHAELLAAQLEQRMAAARPRLLRLARAHGIAPDAADDVAQETLLEAWRHFDALSTPEGLDAWLAAICRNVCRRYVRARGLLAQRQSRLPVSVLFVDGEESEDMSPPDFPDPLVVDPAEELDRQDLETLLDHALGYLPDGARSAVELCYLAEIPQREAALHLGLTIGALEARLHRARSQLRQVLSGALRAEALAFGLTLDDGTEGMASGWRKTRIWCTACGRCRMHGIFEPLPEGRVNLRLRCPGCLRDVSSHGVVPLNGARSFRPAYKRHLRYVRMYLTQGLARGWHPCPFCGSRQPVRFVELDDLGARGGRRPRLRAALQCSSCGEVTDPGVAPALWSHPEAERFMVQHPRWISEPETLVDYEGQPAIRLRLVDITSAARLALFADVQTLAVRAAFHE